MATSKQAVQAALTLFTVCFNGEVDSPRVRVYVRTLADIAPDVIVEAAQLLMDEAAGGRKFFPMPSPPEFKGACAKVITKRRAEAFAKFGDCVLCHNTRWIDVEEEGRNVLKRCSCFTMMLAAAEAAGKPLTLPPASRDDEDRHD